MGELDLAAPLPMARFAHRLTAEQYERPNSHASVVQLRRRERTASMNRRAAKDSPRQVKPREQKRDAAQVVRERRHPGRGLDAIDTDADDASRPMTEEAHPAPPPASSGTLPSHADTDELPVRDPGLSITPEERGEQFLRDATQQDNFESQVSTAERPSTDATIEPLISEASLEAAGQERRGRPATSSLDSRSQDLPPGPPPLDLDVTDDTTTQTSLFDRGVDEERAFDANDEEEAALSPNDTRSPNLQTEEEPGNFEARDAEEAEKQRERERLRRLRPRPRDVERR